jgi:hypothetical protein
MSMSPACFSPNWRSSPATYRQSFDDHVPPADITREVAGWQERPGVSVPTESRIATIRRLRAVAADAGRGLAR